MALPEMILVSALVIAGDRNPEVVIAELSSDEAAAVVSLVVSSDAQNEWRSLRSRYTDAAIASLEELSAEEQEQAARVARDVAENLAKGGKPLY